MPILRLPYPDYGENILLLLYCEFCAGPPEPGPENWLLMSLSLA